MAPRHEKPPETTDSLQSYQHLITNQDLLPIVHFNGCLSSGWQAFRWSLFTIKPPFFPPTVTPTVVPIYISIQF